MYAAHQEIQQANRYTQQKSTYTYTVENHNKRSNRSQGIVEI